MSLSFLSKDLNAQLDAFEQLTVAQRRNNAGLDQFNAFLFDYFQAQGRVLPWRTTFEPYDIFISEVMLQQTQVDRVIDKFQEFMATFPSFKALAEASTADVLKTWQGLGYNRRGLFLQRAAQKIIQDFDGQLPNNPEDLVTLPGIGQATAASITAFAFNKPTVFLETNIRTVFIHFFFPRSREVGDEKLLPLVTAAVPQDRARDWYSALMDFGTIVKKEVGNPTRKSKTYTKQSAFNGSDRQVRGRILKLLLKEDAQTLTQLVKALNEPVERVERIVTGLKKEGFILQHNNTYTLPH